MRMTIGALVSVYAALSGVLFAQPLTSTEFTFQGQLKQNGAPVTGQADFQFLLFNAASGGGQVGSTIGRSFVDVVNGLFTVQLDFGAVAFDGGARWLDIRVEFPSGAGNWTKLRPLQPVTATPYALQTRGLFCDEAGDVGVGTTTPAAKLHVAAGDFRVDGDIHLYDDDVVAMESRTALAGKALEFRNTSTNGRVAEIGTSGSDGAGFFVLRNRAGVTTTVEIDGDGDDTTNDTATGLVRIGSTGGGPGGELAIRNDDGLTRIQAFGGASGDGGTLQLFNGAGAGTLFFDAHDSSDGTIRLQDAGGNTGILLRADYAASVAGEISLFNDNGIETVELAAAEGSTDNGGQITLRKADGTRTIQVDAEYGTDGGGYVEIVGGTTEPTVYIEGGGAGRNDAALRVHNSRPDQGMAAYITSSSTFATMHIQNDGPGETLWLHNGGGGDILVARDDTRWQFWVDGDGITNSRVLRIHGGADLSEGFDVRQLNADSNGEEGAPADRRPQPGMVVSIDPENPGKLAVSSESYDRRVAGIISGAGGVNPGMLMGQSDADADGAHPVALTGRVYCLCDASNGAIEPGDMLTTSDVPGHAMKVMDFDKAQGAIIGKAMTSLSDGQGLVLVLVSLQ